MKIVGKYKKGDLVRVISNDSYHQFEMGEIVKVTQIDPDDGQIWECRAISHKDFRCTDSWAMEDKEVELYAIEAKLKEVK